MPITQAILAALLVNALGVDAHLNRNGVSGNPDQVALEMVRAVVATAGSPANAYSPPAGNAANFYAANSFWNTPIPANAPTDPNSGAMVAQGLVPYARRANFANGAYGVGLVYASNADPTYTISGMRYYNSGPITFHIPRGAQPSSGSDHHLVVINGNQELDMWGARYNPATDRWTAGSAFVGNIKGWGANAAPGQKAGGMYAAGFSGMGGVVTPAQIASGHIDHALSVMVPRTLAGRIVVPATATDGRSRGPGAIPEGARIQLDPSFDVDAQNWPLWEKIIARALQIYGAYVSDTGGSIAFYGQTDANGGMTWAEVGAPIDPSLANLPWQDFRVVDTPPGTAGGGTEDARGAALQIRGGHGHGSRRAEAAVRP